MLFEINGLDDHVKKAEQKLSVDNLTARLDPTFLAQELSNSYHQQNHGDMKVEDKVLIKNLAKTAEIINTINGGMSQAKMQVTKTDEEWLVQLKVPGVEPEQLKIEVRNNQMFIYHIMSGENSSDLKLPYLLTSFVISPRIDFDAILAEYDGNEVFVHMPLDEMNDGHEREIEIFRK